jgi:hypothetical protein
MSKIERARRNEGAADLECVRTRGASIDRAFVKELAELDDAPAISILCPLDSHRPGNAQDPIVLSQLRDRAVEDVEQVLSGSAAASLIARIDEAVGAIDLQHPNRGVAVFVSANVCRVIGLDAPVGPHVVVGRRLSIRDLVTTLSRTKPARVVVLSQAKTRCVDIIGGDATEHLDDGFPVEVAPPTEADAPHGDFPMSEREHAEATKFTFRAVDRALGAIQRHGWRQLVIVGTERDLAYFDEVTRERETVVGHIAGNHERDTPDELARLVRAVIEDVQARECERACGEAREAIGTHALSGIANVWSAARSGRGQRLLVEDGYCYPSRVSGTLTAAPDAKDGAFDAVSDTVEEVIRHDGDVVGVPPQSLADLGYIAMLTRY